MKSYLHIFILLFGINTLHAQKYALFNSWNEVRKDNPKFQHDTIKAVLRTLKDIRFNGGNDYEISSTKIPMKIIDNKLFAVSIGDTMYLNGQKIKVSNRYCKVLLLLKGNKIVFLGSISDKQMAAYDEIVTMYAATNQNEGKFLADLNQKRYLYYINLNKRKPKAICLDRPEMRHLLKYDEELLAMYSKEKFMDSHEVIFKYLSLLNKRKN